MTEEIELARPIIVLLLAVFAASSAACGAATELTSGRAPAAAAEGTTISGFGMSVDLPNGWSGRIFKRDAESAPVLRAANFPVYLGTSTSLADATAEMPSDGIFIELTDLELPVPNPSREGWVQATTPIEIRRSDFGRFEGVATPGFTLRNLVINRRSIMVGVGFGTPDPSETLIAQANQVLALVRIDPDRGAWGGEEAKDPVPRVFFKPPSGWFTAETSFTAPGEDPIPDAWAGNVPFVDDPGDGAFPNATLRNLPSDGIVIEAVGPRPYTGEADFPTWTLPLQLSEGFFASNGYEGQPARNVSNYLIDTRIGGDVLNVTVALGRNEPTAAMIAEANGVLATLSIAR